MSSPRAATENTKLIIHADAVPDHGGMIEIIDAPRRRRSWGEAFSAAGSFFKKFLYALFVTVLFYKVLKPFARGIYDHPIVFVLSIVAASTNGINALFAISGYTPKNLLVGDWWRYMDDFQRALSVIGGVSSLAVNAALFYFFAITVTAEGRKILKQFREGSALERTAIIVCVLLGLVAAAPPFAIGYNAWDWGRGDTWWGIPLALSAGTFNAIQAWLTRMRGILSFRENMFNVGKEHIRLNNAYLNTLSLIPKAHHHRVAARLTHSVTLVLWKERLYRLAPDSDAWKVEASKPLNRSERRKLEIIFNRELVDLSRKHRDLFHHSKSTYYKDKFVYYSIRGSLMVVGATIAELVFAIKGSNAAEILALRFDNVTLRDHISPLDRGLIGAVPGFATLISYGEAAWGLPTLINDIVAGAMIYPSTIISQGIVFVAVCFTGGGNATIARGIIDDKGNILGLSPGTFAAALFSSLTIIYGIIANSRFMTRVAPVIEPKDMTLYTYMRDKDKEPDNFIDEALVVKADDAKDRDDATGTLIEDGDDHEPPLLKSGEIDDFDDVDDIEQQRLPLYPQDNLGALNRAGMRSVISLGMFRPVEDADVHDADIRVENNRGWLGNCQIL